MLSVREVWLEEVVGAVVQEAIGLVWGTERALDLEVHELADILCSVRRAKALSG